MTARRDTKRRGFTLLELMLAISILSVVSVVTYMTFSTVIEAWRRGTAMAEEMHHGDFVIEQIVMAMRSAYYPEADSAPTAYGFWHVDNGDGAEDADEISWVKIGSALVGKEVSFAGSPHRVKLTLEDDEEGRTSVSVRSWRVRGQEEDFDPEDLDPLFLSTKITGFNCRAAFESVDDEIDWLDEWEETNKLPTVVEITLYMEPLDDGEDPVEIKRLLGVRAGELCWTKK
jgi:prepilin-type N-terminal cleavage/methylation domain-containing protein